MTTTLPVPRVRQRTRAGTPVPRPSAATLLELAGHAASRQETTTAAVQVTREALHTPDAAGALAAWARSLDWQGAGEDLFPAVSVTAPSPLAIAASLYRAAREATS